MKGDEHSHPGTTIVLFEPEQRDPAMFLAATFSHGQRRRLAEHAYQQTRRMLRSRRGTGAALRRLEEVPDDLDQVLAARAA